MKKLMTIAAVALCTAAIADSGNSITSSSIVGYKAENLQDGFTMMTPCFVPVSDAKGGIDLTSLTPGGEYSSGDVMVQTLTAAGLADKSYTYKKPRTGTTWFWQDVDTNETIANGDVVFDSGDGLWVYGVNASSLTSSGAVSTDDITVSLQDGFTATGNMTPVNLDLTAIVPSGDYASGDIMIQTLTATGLADKSYTFKKPRTGTTWFWQDVDTNETIVEGDVIFAPGAGLWVYGVKGSAITIPAPTL